jgi:serine phosphatase RsbU (regulator of sigma subunit)
VQAEVGPGDLLVLVSDGVVEAMDEAGTMFGFERLEAAVTSCDGSSAFVFVAELREVLAGFMGMAEAHDDMTIMVLRPVA